MIFVCSMGDLFHESVPFDYVDRVFAVMELCPWHTFLILTKRPQRMADYMGAFDGYIEWPLPNVWLGVTAENQAMADERIPILLQIPAAVRFVSIEPLLSCLDLSKWIARSVLDDRHRKGVFRASGIGEIQCGSGRSDMETRGDGRGQPDRESVLFQTISRSATGRDECKDGVPCSNVFSRGEEKVGGICSQDSLDESEQFRNSGFDGDKSQRFGSGQSSSIKLGACDEIGECITQFSRNIAQKERSTRTDECVCQAGGARCIENQATMQRQSFAADENCRDVRGNTINNIINPSPPELDAYLRLDWIVCGGETGPKARPMHPDWARSLRDQCHTASVPFFFKSWGEWGLEPYGNRKGLNPYKSVILGSEVMFKCGKKAAGRLLDGREWAEMPEVRT